MIQETNSFSSAYLDLLWRLDDEGINEVNARTGVHITALPGGHSFKLDLSGGRIPVPGNRRYWPRVAAAEVAWQFMGTKDPSFIMEKAPKVWGAFIEDGKIKTAYGYRWRRCFGRDQIALALRALRNDPSNRQVYVSAWNPATDGLGQPGQPKNIPCPVGFSVTQVDDTIHMSVFLRSSDVFVGLPYDVMAYALTLDAIAHSLGYHTGSLHVTLAHAHSYEPHDDMVIESLYGSGKKWVTGHEPEFPRWTVEQIETDPHGYVDQVDELCRGLPVSDYSPKPMVVV